MNFRRAAAGMAIALALAALIIARDLGLFRKLRHHAFNVGQPSTTYATALARKERSQPDA